MTKNYSWLNKEIETKEDKALYEKVAAVTTKMVRESKVPRHLYRYMGFSYLEESLLKNSLRFSRPSLLNDPFDCRYNITQEFSYEQILKFLAVRSKGRSVQEVVAKAKELYSKPQSINSIINDSVNKTLNSTMVCCFSEVWDNILMWSHYTNGHKGVTLQFDILEDPYFFSVPMKIEYSETYPNSINTDLPDALGLDILSTKFIDWNYEKEHRIVKFYDLPSEGMYYSFEKKALKQILFGHRVTDNEMYKIIRLCLDNGYINTEFKKIDLDNTAYRLNQLTIRPSFIATEEKNSA